MLGMLACVEQQEQPTMTIHEYCRQYADTYFQETSPNEKIEYMQGLIRNERGEDPYMAAYVRLLEMIAEDKKEKH